MNQLKKIHQSIVTSINDNLHLKKTMTTYSNPTSSNITFNIPKFLNMNQYLEKLYLKFMMKYILNHHEYKTNESLYEIINWLTLFLSDYKNFHLKIKNDQNQIMLRGKIVENGLSLLTRIYIEHKEFDKADQLADLLIEMFPQVYKGYLFKANRYAKLKQYKLALNILENAKQLIDSNNPNYQILIKNIKILKKYIKKHNKKSIKMIDEKSQINKSISQETIPLHIDTSQEAIRQVTDVPIKEVKQIQTFSSLNKVKVEKGEQAKEKEEKEEQTKEEQVSVATSITNSLDKKQNTQPIDTLPLSITDSLSQSNSYQL